jgi:hypothetical protein
MNSLRALKDLGPAFLALYPAYGGKNELLGEPPFAARVRDCIVYNIWLLRVCLGEQLVVCIVMDIRMLMRRHMCIILYKYTKNIQNYRSTHSLVVLEWKVR